MLRTDLVEEQPWNVLTAYILGTSILAVCFQPLIFHYGMYLSEYRSEKSRVENTARTEVPKIHAMGTFRVVSL